MKSVERHRDRKQTVSVILMIEYRNKPWADIDQVLPISSKTDQQINPQNTHTQMQQRRK